MGPFESQIQALGESLPAGRRQVLRAANEALTPDEKHLFTNVAKTWLHFKPALTRPELGDENLWKRKGGIQVVKAARDLAYHVLRSRTPPRSVRDIAKVVKPFTTLRRQPRDVKQWFARNRNNLFTVLSAKDWESAEAAVEVGDFLVSDTTGKGGVEQIVKLVKSVSEKIRRSGLPNVSKILYGHVFITSDLTGGMAFYRIKQDNVWIRPQTRFGPASEHSLAHELGHRYWHKFMSSRVQAGWIDWDRGLRATAKATKAGNVIYPRVGQNLPMPIQGSAAPRVLRIEQAGNEQRFYISRGEYLTDRQIRKFYAMQARDGMFPTTYSMQSNDHEEHFSEAFGLRILNQLEEPHRSKFREIVG